jgi:serine/threonine protein kinase
VPSLSTKLQTEIKIHRTLRHERIVRFDQFFEDRENVYILLELCHNHSMSELMRKNKRFTDEETRRYMLQMLEATHYCHTFGIIHRDLKLGNLFLDRNWDIKVGDFGLAAKLTDDNERKRTVCGTPNYIAPEILDGSTGHSFQVSFENSLHRSYF